MILNANALSIPLAPGTIQTCVTSPPYYGLRDYGIDGQLGLEQTPQEYIENMVAVFREVWRVLRDDGTLWLNLGDSYCNSNGYARAHPEYQRQGRNDAPANDRDLSALHLAGYKTKDLLGIPWRVALALQADGWYLRSDIIWHKPNPMPESVTDRPTKSHEYIFLMTKSARYYYDAEAVKEDSVDDESYQGRRPRGEKTIFKNGGYAPGMSPQTLDNGNGELTGKTYEKRNRRTVWTVATQPYPGAHFATFPPKLIEPCILAGTSAKGQCPKCGAAWERVVERENDGTRQDGEKRAVAMGHSATGPTACNRAGEARTSITTGWQPACTCNAGEPVPQIVLDPFSGSGTTGRVAVQHGRQYVGLELNPEYIKLAPDRMTVQVVMI
jgi:DNA modification methylase